MYQLIINQNRVNENIKLLKIYSMLCVTYYKGESQMKRIRDYGIVIGSMKTGRLNKITDVPNVKVGHVTLKEDGAQTGVTAVLLQTTIFSKIR